MDLKKAEILSLYNATTENCYELFKAALHMATKYEGKKYVSLGIAELALEELGKSYSLLAQYSKPHAISDWKQFWKDWRAHEIKAARGFFYEFFCTIRVEITNPTDPLLSEIIPRGKFSVEKELAFYVDIDKNSRAIHVPGENISDEEAMSRVFSLFGLLNPALKIRDWLNSEEPDDFKDAISDYAYVTLTEEVYQQDIPEILQSLKGSNKDYNRALDDIWDLFNPDKLGNDVDQTE
ncbi:MAG: AbiV family abortive infection protein [Flavobacterium sp.]|nr:MAG: AbiV family abortive infection protein [Flavobacterium sp.]